MVPDRLREPIYQGYEALRKDFGALRSIDRAGVLDKDLTAIGASPDGKWQIPVAKIGRNPKHRVLILGGAHAREWIAVAVPYLLAELLVKIANNVAVHKYYDGFLDKVRRLVRNSEIWVVPMLNPEGNAFSHQQEPRWWRKNRRFLEFFSYTTHQGDTWGLLYRFFGHSGGNGSNNGNDVYLAKLALARGIELDDSGVRDWQELATINAARLEGRNVPRDDPNAPLPAGVELRVPVYGVDLNRNYPYEWGKRFDQGTGSIVSWQPDVRSGEYFGTAQASEYETQAIVRLFENAEREDLPFRAALSYHSFAEVVLYPSGLRPEPTEHQAVANFAAHMTRLINAARNPNSVADLKRAKKEEQERTPHLGESTDPELRWIRSPLRRYYTHINPGRVSWGGMGGSFLDWAHFAHDGMPAYTIELSPRTPAIDAPRPQVPVDKSEITEIFRENLPAALAVIEYGNFQRRSRRRGSAYRCHLFSYAGPQTKGVVSQWTQNLEPITREVFTNEYVELFVTIRAGTYPITENSKIRFDILEEDHILTGWTDDRIVSFLGTGVDSSEEGFTPQKKDTKFRRLESADEPLHSVIDRYKEEEEAFENHILVLESTADGASHHHILTWWKAERLEDFANSEFYFIINVDDSFEDQSDAILDVKADTLPEGTAVKDRVRAALILIDSQLGTGITDWAVTDNEALAALRILLNLDPEILLRVVMRMRPVGTWETFQNQLPLREARMHGLLLLERMISPHSGYLMPGDSVSVTVIPVSVGGRVSKPEFEGFKLRVTDEGLRLPMLKRPVSVVGKFPDEAANAIADAYIGGLILHNPWVKIEIFDRGLLYPPVGAFAPVLYESRSRLDPDSPAVQRLRKQENFINYISGLTGRDAFVVNATSVYLKWIRDHYQTKEFLTRAPEDLWSWALEKGARVSVPPIMRYLALNRRMLARVEEAPAEEKQKILDALTWYQGWLDANQARTAVLEQNSPGAIWLRAWGRAVEADIQRMRREVERRVREQRREAELQAHWQAAERKLDQALRLTMTRIWQLPAPQVERDPSAGIGYLIMPSEGERMVRDVIARGFLDDLMRRIREVDPGFANTTVEGDFIAWIDARPELRDALWLTQAHPAVERFAIERNIPAWQTAVEVGVGFIPIVGQIVGVYEVISGQDLFGNPLSGTDRAIMGAAILLPAAAKIYRVGRGAITAGKISKAYRLSPAAADAVFLATSKIKPGSVGARLLTAARTDILAARPVTDPQRLRQLAALLQDMGMTERATARALSASGRAARQLPRRFDRLDLARTLPDLTSEQVRFLEQLGEDAWARLFSYASRRTRGFQSTKAGARTGAISSVKGKIAEELIPQAEEFSQALRRAQARAVQEGIDPQSVRFVTNVMGQAPTATSAGAFAELTDGMFVAVHNNKLRIFTILESKSPSNLRALATRKGEALGQIGWDFERLAEVPVRVDQPLRMSDELIVSGRVFEPADVIVSRHTTEWLGVAPPSFNLSGKQLRAIRDGMPGFQLFHGPVEDEALNKIAERLLQLLVQSQ